MAENNQGFHVYDDDGRDISSYSKANEFEDISSSSANAGSGDDYINFESFSENKHFNKRKHGAASAPDKVTAWWKNKSKGKRALMSIGIALFTIACLFVIWKWVPFGIRGKLFSSAFGLLCLTLGCGIFIKWKKRVFQTVLTSMGAVLLSVILVLTCTKASWGFLMGFFYNFDHTFEDADIGAQPTIDEKIVNIALFGIDTRSAESFTGNTDSIMILSLNTKDSSIKITSIMRDSLVPIETDNGTIYHKINSAYSRGYNSKEVKGKSQEEKWNNGAVWAVRTINKIFDLDISDYATVNFFGMAEIIDAVGGIDVELTEREVTARGKNNYGINDMITEVCHLMKLKPADYHISKSGKQHLNGVQAVAYSRIRYVPNIWGSNNDYGRTERQRYVMEQLFHKALTIDSSKYLSLIKTLIPYTRTSMSPDKILEFAKAILGRSPTFQKAQIPPDSSFLMRSPSGSFGSVVYYDLELAGKMIHSFIYDNVSFEDYLVNNDIDSSDYNDWYRNLGLGGSSGSATNPPPTTSKPDDGSSSSSEDSNSSEEEDDTESDIQKPDDEDDTSTNPGDGDGDDEGNGDEGEDPPPSGDGETETPSEESTPSSSEENTSEDEL